jgi:hypothetical protein
MCRSAKFSNSLSRYAGRGPGGDFEPATRTWGRQDQQQRDACAQMMLRDQALVDNEPRTERTREVSGFGRHLLLRGYAPCAAPSESYEAITQGFLEWTGGPLHVYACTRHYSSLPGGFRITISNGCPSASAVGVPSFSRPVILKLPVAFFMSTSPPTVIPPVSMVASISPVLVS